ncbi:unnamed protein product [Caenorhabditis brenneri]
MTSNNHAQTATSIQDFGQDSVANSEQRLLGGSTSEQRGRATSIQDFGQDSVANSEQRLLGGSTSEQRGRATSIQDFGQDSVANSEQRLLGGSTSEQRGRATSIQDFGQDSVANSEQRLLGGSTSEQRGRATSIQDFGQDSVANSEQRLLGGTSSNSDHHVSGNPSVLTVEAVYQMRTGNKMIATYRTCHVENCKRSFNNILLHINHLVDDHKIEKGLACILADLDPMNGISMITWSFSLNLRGLKKKKFSKMSRIQFDEKGK